MVGNYIFYFISAISYLGPSELLFILGSAAITPARITPIINQQDQDKPIPGRFGQGQTSLSF